MQLHPSYHLAGASPSSLDEEYLFLVGSSILLSMVVPQQGAILEFLQEKMNARPCSPLSCWFFPVDSVTVDMSLGYSVWLPLLQVLQLVTEEGQPTELAVFLCP